MSNEKSSQHTNEELRIGSTYYAYHVRMYVETLLWLQGHQEKPEGWATIRNSMIEAHLVHARVLINFICNSHSQYGTDVLAINYFHDTPNTFYPPQNAFLKNQANSIGGQLVHLTTKPMPKLKSEQDWLMRETANQLVPALKEFLTKVSETKVEKDVRSKCLTYLEKLSPPEIPVSLNAST